MTAIQTIRSCGQVVHGFGVEHTVLDVLNDRVAFF